MSAVLLAALLAAQPEPYRIDLVTITLDDARTLNGKRVRVSFTTGKPSYALNGVTVTGPTDQENDGEDVSRGVILRGEQIIDLGARVEVVGQLRVIDHPARIVNGVPVPGWVEVRVEEGR
ncbi:MAG TPA: hypothetical protein VKE74_15200 [Gemmataceae bacterium]|nr:hypothetical protein [Gemmataceae bacterium]